MEPNWGMVEILLLGGLEYLSNYISEPTEKIIYDDLADFRFGEVYELLDYIAKKNKCTAMAVEEAGRFMGYLPPDTSPSDSTPQPAPVRQIKAPLKSPFPLHWSKIKITEEVNKITFDENIDSKTLWTGFKIKQSTCNEISIKVIYTHENNEIQLYSYYPDNIPLTTQNNRVGLHRSYIESSLGEALDQLRNFIPNLDYIVNKNLIERGIYKFEYVLLREASQKCEIAPDALEWAGQLLGDPDAKPPAPDPSPVEP